MIFLIIYQKNNGYIFSRIVVNIPMFKEGSYTSSGWKILSIQLLVKNKFVNYDKFKNSLKIKTKQRYIERIKNDKILNFLENVRDIF